MYRILPAGQLFLLPLLPDLVDVYVDALVGALGVPAELLVEKLPNLLLGGDVHVGPRLLPGDEVQLLALLVASVPFLHVVPLLL